MSFGPQRERADLTGHANVIGGASPRLRTFHHVSESALTASPASIEATRDEAIAAVRTLIRRAGDDRARDPTIGD